jgi:RNA polymerase sigma factor (sigma-70 family)
MRSSTLAPWSQSADRSACERTQEHRDLVTDAGEIAALVTRAAAGDQQAWNVIVDRYTSLLWAVGRAHRLSSADVSDVTQTTWLRLLENLGRIREPERLPGWLATTARHECLRVLRRAGRETPGWDEPVLTERPDPDGRPTDEALLTDERDSELWRCFRRLTERCQRLLRVLMAAEPSSYAEVSAALDIPVGSIGPTRMRCLRDLGEIARESGYPFRFASGGGY